VFRCTVTMILCGTTLYRPSSRELPLQIHMKAMLESGGASTASFRSDRILAVAVCQEQASVWA
jgi:hypothetical protein